MALEFRTREENYKGHGILPSGTTIWRAKVFVDQLPPGFPTEPYKPYIIIDKHSHRSRYVIDTHIMIEQDAFTLVGVKSSGRDHVNPETIQLVMNNSIERGGLDVVVVSQHSEYQGTLHPISETIAEASHPPGPPFARRPQRQP
jgi:hypothetical protein